jgi:hypothetical protein
MTLRPKEVDSGAAEALAGAVRDLHGRDFYVEAEALAMAQEFASWLPTADMRNRLRTAQNAFVVAVANSGLCSPTIAHNLTPLRELFATYPPVLVWVLHEGGPSTLTVSHPRSPSPVTKAPLTSIIPP